MSKFKYIEGIIDESIKITDLSHDIHLVQNSLLLEIAYQLKRIADKKR